MQAAVLLPLLLAVSWAAIQVDACIIKAVDHIKPRLVKGIPELNVPSYEPLIIPEIILSRGPKGAKLEAVTRNLSVSGPSLFEIKKLESNLTENMFKFDLLLPRLSFDADYELEMILLALPIRGRGRLHGNFTNYQSTVRMRGKLVRKDDGEDYLEFERMKIRLLVGDSQLHLDGLFGSDSILDFHTTNPLN
ncbi:hypothetical protein B566_EDAN001450 [Ephemera danica]|nr:hypothetical protein B566_EDAN001450 [Ephemera danica]